MKILADYELPLVSGGDHWGYENSDGSLPEPDSQGGSSVASSYSTGSSGIWGTPSSGLSGSQMASCLGSVAGSGAAAAQTADKIQKAIGVPDRYRGPIDAVAGVGGALYGLRNCAEP